MSQPVKVSVIVPVYNAEPYLRQCLDSIVGQTLPEIEIICVDDGSTDSSPAILEEYRAHDGRVRIIRQENLYAGAARNAGMAAAQGKYLMFWDADDYFDVTALEKLYAKCEADQADICVCGGKQYYEDKGIELPTGVYLSMKRVPETVPFNRLSNPDYIYGFTNAAPWNKMFRRSFVEEQGLRFQPVRNGNDVYFVVCALGLADRITVVNEPLICYRRNQGSSLVGTLAKSPLSPVQAWIDAHRTLEERACLAERSFANKAIGSMVYLLRNIRTSWPAFQAASLRLKEGGLEEMGVREQPEGYYYNPFHAEFLSHLLHDSTEEFLMSLLFATYVQLTESDNRKKIADLKNKEKNDELKAKNAALSAELKEIKAALKAEEKEAGRLEKELKKTRESWSFRIGHALMWLPGKIMRLFRRNG